MTFDKTMDAGVPDKLSMLGRHIKNAVFEKTKIPVSVGIARTKTLAKLADHIAKLSPKADRVLDTLGQGKKFSRSMRFL